MKVEQIFSILPILLIILLSITSLHVKGLNYYYQILELVKNVNKCPIQDVKVVLSTNNNYTIMMKLRCNKNVIEKIIKLRNLTIFNVQPSDNLSTIVQISIPKSKLHVIYWKEKKILFLLITKYSTNISTKFESNLNRVEFDIGSAIPYGLITISKDYVDIHCSNAKLDYDYYNQILNIKLLGITRKTIKNFACGFSYVKKFNYLIILLLSFIVAITLLILLLSIRSIILLRST